MAVSSTDIQKRVGVYKTMTRQTARGKLRKTTIRQAQDALSLLFPSVQCTVAPNGENEIWVKDEQGYGFALKLSAGNAGVGATIRKFVGSSPVSVTGNLVGDWEPIKMIDAVEVTTTVYRHDARSQAFKRWYAGDIDPDTKERVPHPDEVGKTVSSETGRVSLPALLTGIRIATVIACVWSVLRFGGLL